MKKKKENPLSRSWEKCVTDSRTDREIEGRTGVIS